MDFIGDRFDQQKKFKYFCVVLALQCVHWTGGQSENTGVHFWLFISEDMVLALISNMAVGLLF